MQREDKRVSKGIIRRLATALGMGHWKGRAVFGGTGSREGKGKAGWEGFFQATGHQPHLLSHVPCGAGLTVHHGLINRLRLP